MSRRTKRRKRERLVQQERREAHYWYLYAFWDSLHQAIIEADVTDEKRQELLDKLGPAPTKDREDDQERA